MNLGSRVNTRLRCRFLQQRHLYAGVIFEPVLPTLMNFHSIPWWAWSLILIAATSAFGYFRITLSARAMTLALVCEVVLVFVWDAIIAVKGGPEGRMMQWLNPASSFSGSVGLALLFAVTSFSGFEATAVFREEARDPEVTIPRATYISILAMAFFMPWHLSLSLLGWAPQPL